MSRNNPWKTLSLGLLLVMVLALVAACSEPQASVGERQDRVRDQVGVTDPRNQAYMEAVMMAKIEQWKDDEAKVVNAYLFSRATGGLAVPPIRCVGTPVATTEDLEPDNGVPRGSSSYFLVETDFGPDILTNNIAGRDTTFGDDVPALECLDVGGDYHRWGADMDYYVTSRSLAFPPSNVGLSLEEQVRLVQATELIRQGRCVNPETLTEEPCRNAAPFAPPPPAPATPAAPTDETGEIIGPTPEQ